MSKWFPKFYDTLMEPLEKRKFKQIRRDLISKAHGKVLEIGSGTGVNFPFYKQIENVIAIEPEPMMREQSHSRTMNAAVPIEVIAVEAEELPFPDDFFDTVVATLVFCTILDPVKALQEIRRVCKPGGKVLFFEHVRMNHPILGKLQDCLTPLWKHLCDGCHLNRNTLELVKRSGFEITLIEKYYKDLFLVIEAQNSKMGIQ